MKVSLFDHVNFTRHIKKLQRIKVTGKLIVLSNTQDHVY